MIEDLLLTASSKFVAQHSRRLPDAARAVPVHHGPPRCARVDTHTHIHPSVPVYSGADVEARDSIDDYSNSILLLTSLCQRAMAFASCSNTYVAFGWVR